MLPTRVLRWVSLSRVSARGVSQAASRSASAVASRLASPSASPPERWLLCGSVCVSRPPVLTPDKTQLEEDVAAMLQSVESRDALLSDHELRVRAESRRADRRGGGGGDDDRETSLHTALDLEHAAMDERDAFLPSLAPRHTPADTAGDTRTTWRRLDRTLYLTVRQQVADIAHWCLPFSPHTSPHHTSLRETCQATLDNLGVEHDCLYFMGNSPVGFYSYRLRNHPSYTGVKVFFFKAFLNNTTRDVTVTCGDSVSDYQWLTREEMKQLFTSKYYSSVAKFAYEPRLR